VAEKRPESASNSHHAQEDSTRRFLDTGGGIMKIFKNKTVRKEYFRKERKRPSTKGKSVGEK
jgi:hypothetical protein